MASGPLSGSLDPRPADGPSASSARRPGEAVSDASETSLPCEIGPYRLERLLGTGGMGDVYQAYDRRLQRRVAIKHFRPGSPVGSTAAGTASRERFLREARAAAGLSHPSIVHIHDILEHEAGDWEGDWIVMERVDGPTVAQLVAQGALPVEQAITIGRQVAEGLAAAHRQGILHRDLKSENVMLGRDGRAKILDFGLAKRLWPGEMEASLSLEGRVLGTCRTMSPEQARGQELDARSDLFALGVLLYEMLTGESPFLEDTHVDTLAKVCHHHPPPVNGLNPEVPEELSELVGWLLRKERELRPSEAREVVEVLAEMDATLSRSGSVSRSGSRSRTGSRARSAVSGSPVGSGDASARQGGWSPDPGSTLFGETVLDVPGSQAFRSGAPASSQGGPPGSSTGRWRWSLASLGLESPYRPSVRHRMVITAAVGLAVMLGLVAWSLRGVMFSSEAPTIAEATPAVRPAVAVLGFKNLSQDEGVAWISIGIAEMLNAELAASPELRTVAGETIARAKRELALGEGETLGAHTLSKVRSILGVDKVVVGSYLAVPGADELRLVLNLQDTEAGITQKTISETASRTEILALVSRVGERVRRELGSGPLSPDGTRAARAALPRSTEALELYSEGLRQMRAYELVRARDLFRQAVEAEPDFPLAHAALAEAWSALGYDGKAQEQVARAVELAGDLSKEDRLFVEARDHEMSWRWDEAIQSYRTLWDFFPDNVEYGLRMAGALTTAGRGREALEVVAEMRELPAPASEDVRIDLAEGKALISLSDYEELLAVAARTVGRATTQGARILAARARLHEMFSRLRMGQPEEAVAPAQEAHRLFKEAGDPRGETLALNGIANLAFEAGRIAEARALFDQARQNMERIGNHKGLASALNNIASCTALQGDLKTAQELLEEASELTEEIGDELQAGLTRVNLGEILRRRGELKLARQTIQEALTICRRTNHLYAANFGLLTLGRIHLAAGDLEPARESLEEALEANQSTGDLRYVAYSLESLGDLALQGAALDTSRQRYREALEIRERLHDESSIAESRLALARAALEEKQPEVALGHAERALGKSPGLDSEEQQLRADTIRLVSLWALERHQEAADLVGGVESLIERCQDVETRLWSGIQLARVELQRGTDQAAEQRLRAIEDEAGQRGLVPLELEARLGLADVEEARGQDSGARLRRREVRDRAQALELFLLVQKAGPQVGEASAS